MGDEFEIKFDDYFSLIENIEEEIAIVIEEHIELDEFRGYIFIQLYVTFRQPEVMT